MASSLPVKTNHRQVQTARNALLAYSVFFLALISPFWLLGEVISPYRLSTEVGAIEAAPSSRLENRKFSDYWNGYIPEIHDSLEAPHSGWLALWTNQNELGRPLLHLHGFSPAYLPTWLISRVIHDPQRVITLLSLGTCFLAGLFVLLLCRQLSLAPLAGLLTGGSTAASPLFMYWLTFPMLPAALCWTAGILYASTRLEKNADLLGWGILAFSCYSLLMTGYPQLVIFHAYILAGYLGVLSYRRWEATGLAATARYLAIVMAAAGFGGLLALPIYWDLARMAAQSARVAPDVSFFTVYLPKLDSIMAAVRVLVLGTFPEVLGNPISPTYPFVYDGFSMSSALIIFLALFGLLHCLRATWGWWLVIVLICALGAIHPLYTLGVKYLGFNISAVTPTVMIDLPLTMICAYAADALVRRPPNPALVIAAVLGTLACLLVALCFGLAEGLSIRWSVVVTTLLVVCLLAGLINSSRPALLVAAMVITGMYVSFPLMLRQPPSEIVATSPLLKKVIANVPAGSRFAVAEPGLQFLPPNLNAVFELASIHSYNSMSSRRYRSLIGVLGGEVQTYRRSLETISDYGSLAFWMSNISLILSPTKLSHRNLEEIGKEDSVNIYRVVSRMGCCLQVKSPFRTDPDGVELLDSAAREASRPSKIRDEGDLLEIDVQEANGSLLVLSQQFHHDWQAVVRTPSGWTEARTLPVNGVFQGVILPAEAQTVRLDFVPFVRFAWIGHLLWAIALIGLAAQLVRSRWRHHQASRATRKPPQ